jgi:hypothetical protein
MCDITHEGDSENKSYFTFRHSLYTSNVPSRKQVVFSRGGGDVEGSSRLVTIQEIYEKREGS